MAEQIGGGEIIGNAAPLVIGGSADQPHQQEESHHGGDEVGVGDLPVTAVRALFDDLFLLDDDRAAALALLDRTAHPASENRAQRSR
jgi:hypothetical protein